MVENAWVRNPIIEYILWELISKKKSCNQEEKFLRNLRKLKAINGGNS